MPRPSVTTIADQVFYSTVRIETVLPDATSTGTGFLLLYNSGEVGYPVLVTNKHVLADASSAVFTLARAENGVPTNAGTQITMTDFGPQAWLGHPREDVDVAVMAFGPALNEMDKRGAPAYYRAFGSDLLLTEAQADSLDSIENVTFVGYPNGLFDTASMLPIARRGQTATPIFNDYRGWPAFLIDASVFPGSSGSPVLILDRGSYTTRDGNTYLASRLHVAGVIAAVHTRRVHGEVLMVANGVASFDDAIDLGIVFKASAIQECVDLLFQRMGVDLTGAPDANALA